MKINSAIFVIINKSEKNFKKLTEMCSEFLEAQTEWKHALTGEAAAIDPNKETVIFIDIDIYIYAESDREKVPELILNEIIQY